jgi:dTDP-glucose 4,6-dehydratase
MKSVLVTGAWGFIGSYFCKLVLRSTDWKLTAFGRAGSSRSEKRLAEPDCERSLLRIRGDLTDASSLSGICEGIDYVVHFAAKTFVDHSIIDPNPFIQSNVVGTYNLLEQARKYRVERFVQVSTDEVYGSIAEGAYNEDSRFNPTNPYAATKAAADSLALAYHHTYGLPVIITRTENSAGPYQHPQKVFPTFVQRALEGEKLRLYGDGKHVRQWLHVEDHCRAIMMLLDRGTPGHIYHIAGNQELANIDLARAILRVMDGSDVAFPAKGYPFDERITFIDDAQIRPCHDRRYALNSDKIRALGWRPQFTLNQLVEETTHWYVNNRWWY